MKPLKILIVEDEFVTALAIQEALEREGHRITDQASNGKQVIASLNRELPDVVLMDIVLENSEMNGIEIATMIQSSYSLPLIYLTAQSDPMSTRTAQLTRPTAYLFKPFRHQELAVQVELAYMNYWERKEFRARTNHPDYIMLPVDQGKAYVKVTINEVQFLAAAKSYVLLYLLDEAQPKVFSMNLGYLEQYFPKPQFHRLGRSLLVNLTHVERIERGQLWVKGRSEPIDYPETHYGEFIKNFNIIKTP
jgi:DNA-binding LytR/AlgR family response regulator